jgi:hypothetical protein
VRLTRSRQVLAGVVALAVVATACSSGGDGGADGGDDGELAVAMCGALREQTNVLARLANSSVAGIGNMTPEERYAAILAGFDAAEEAGRAYGEQVEVLALPPIAEAGDLHAQLVEGAAQAVEEIDDERATFLDKGSTVPDDEVQGSVGEFFNSIEKMMSVAEPALGQDDRPALLRALRDEPTCEHVIQPPDPDQLD